MGDCLSEYLHVRSVECFHACVDENKAHIYSVARRILGDAALAEDVTQEVFTKVASARWDPETIRSGKAFLSQVAISIARTRRRTHRKRRRRENPLETAACQVSNAPDVDRILDVREAVERLPTELRLWVELKFYCDLTPAEISTHLGISERVAQRRLTVAYELLRKRLATPAMTTLSGALLALQAQTHAFPPALDERLQQLVAQQSPHPPRRVGKLSLSAILAASVVLISALAVVALGTRRVERPEVATPLDDAAATPLRATGRQRPWLRAPDGWREAWRQLALRWQQVDWEALRDKVAQLDVEREAIGEIRIEDSDGTLFKSGRIDLTWPIAAQSEWTLTPGVVGIAPGVLKQVLSGELADANPLTFPVHAEVLGASLRLRVAIDGHPLVEKDDVIFGTGTTRVKVTVPSRPRTLVRVLEGWR